MADIYDPAELAATVVDEAHQARRLRAALRAAEAEIERLRGELVKRQEDQSSSKTRQRRVR